MQITLNLLSPEKKTVLRTGFIFAYVQTMLFMMFIVIAFAAGTLLAVRMMLTTTYEDLAKRSGDESTETKSITTDIKSINDYLKRIDGLGQRFVPWSRVLEELTRAMPEGIRLTQIRVEKDGKITLSGVARDRQDVLTLQSRLGQSPTFKDVKAPLSNILQQKDVNFDFELRYAKSEAK